jgi:hypothetical protein
VPRKKNACLNKLHLIRDFSRFCCFVEHKAKKGTHSANYWTDVNLFFIYACCIIWIQYCFFTVFCALLSSKPLVFNVTLQRIPKTHWSRFVRRTRWVSGVQLFNKFALIPPIHCSRDVRRYWPIFHLLAECDQHHFTVIRLIGTAVWRVRPCALSY